jgi:anti-anti-sigma factor
MPSSLGVARLSARLSMPGALRPILGADHVREGAGVVVTLVGEIDISSAEEVRTAVAESLHEPLPASVTLDVSALTFCDCSGIRALRWARDRVLQQGLVFRLVGADLRLRRTLSLAQADDLLAACEPLLHAPLHLPELNTL